MYNLSLQENKVKQLVKDIKDFIFKSLKTKKTDKDLALEVEELITSKGYKVEFPTCVLQDKVISNTTPIKSQELNFKVLTVDFGFRDSKNNIIDTAISFSTCSKIDFWIDLYRATITNIEKEITTLLTTKELTIGDITTITEKNFLTTGLNVVPYCCAHTIPLGTLHGECIPMCKKENSISNFDFKILEELRFTIEPHVLIEDEEKNQTKYKLLKPTIISDEKGNIDSLDQRLGNLKGTKFQKYYPLESNKLSFYEEHTYVIRNNNLLRLT